MELYINVSFWVTLITLICRMILLNAVYPRVQKISLGTDMFNLISTIGFFIWLSYIKFNMG